MGSFKTKTKTKSSATSTPLDQYAPYITQGLTAAQDTMKANQASSQELGTKALDVYNGLGAQQNTVNGIANGTNPAQANYGRLQNAAANDPSTGILAQMSKGSTSPGQYDGIGAGNPALAALQGMTTQNNPALGMLSGMTNQQVNGDTSQFYKDTLSGKYLNNNPYIDAIAQQGQDAALKSVNQRFAASGMGEGLSTPYAQAAGDSITNANNTLRYGAYNNELNRMGQIGGQSDSQYNATQDRSLSAANSYGSLYGSDRDRSLAAAQGLGSLSNSTDALRLNAQQAKDSAFGNDRAAQLAAAQSLGSQYNANNATSLGATNDDLQSRLSAAGLSGQISAEQLSALAASAQLPYTGANNYANLINSLTAKYGNQTGTSTSTSSQGLGSVAAGLGGSILSGWASGGFKGI